LLFYHKIALESKNNLFSFFLLLLLLSVVNWGIFELISSDENQESTPKLIYPQRTRLQRLDYSHRGKKKKRKHLWAMLLNVKRRRLHGWQEGIHQTPSLLSMSNHHKAYATRQGKTYRKYGIKQSAYKLKYRTRIWVK